MNKKFLLYLMLLLMISFSTGIFVEIATPDTISLSTEPPGFWVSLWGNLKSDLFLLILVVFFTLTVYLMPCIIFLILCKTFSLGFSSAYLLSIENAGLGMVLSVIFPRALIKIPVYIALILLSWKTARESDHPRRNIRNTIKNYAFCLLALAVSSLIEVVLLQAAF